MPMPPFILPSALPSSPPGLPGQLVLDFVDWAGVPHVLDGSAGVTALLGASGLELPPMVPIEQVVPLGAGARLRYVATGVREMTLPILIKAASYPALWTMLGTVATWFDPTQPRGTSALVAFNGNSVLRVYRPSGGTRVVNCYCSDGMQLVMDEQNSGGLWQQAIVTLRSPDPYWYDPAPTVNAPFAVPFISGTTFFSSQTLTPTGDVDCWPIWTISYTVAASQGAANVTFLVSDTTTGYSFSITYQSAATSGVPVPHTLVIDTRPTVKTITLDGSTNEYQGLAVAASTLFPLAAGANALSYTITSTQVLTGTLTAQCTYTNRYNGA